MPKPHCYEHPRPAVTVDAVAFTIRDGALRVLLIRRKADPFAGRWAIPGGFLDMDEPVEAGARRELREETGLETPAPFTPIGFFGAVDRDPRGRTISLAFATAFRAPAPDPRGADDAAEAAWLDPDRVGPLAFDHDAILGAARTWLGRGVEAGPAGLAMLPDPFTAADVQTLFIALYGNPSGAIAWRRKLEAAGAILPAGGRPARYRAAGPSPRVVPGREEPGSE